MILACVPFWGTLILTLGGGVPPGPENPYPIWDQNIWFTIPYFRPILHKCIPYFRPIFETFFFCNSFHLFFLPFVMHCLRWHISIYAIPGQKHKIDTLFQTKKANYTPYFRLKMFENNTLWGGTYLYGIYIRVLPPPTTRVPLLFEEYSSFII